MNISFFLDFQDIPTYLPTLKVCDACLGTFKNKGIEREERDEGRRMKFDQNLDIIF